MGPPVSYSTLGSVAVGPPDKMGSAISVLAKTGQKGRELGLQSRAGMAGAVAVLGAEAECICFRERLRETHRRLRGHSLGNSPTLTLAPWFLL